MSKYIIRDDKKIIFMKNHEILFENKKPQKIVLSKHDYDTLASLCKKVSIFEKSRCTPKLFDILYKNDLLVEANNHIIDNYNTPYERTELFLSTFLKDKNLQLLNNKRILFIGAGGIASEIINQLLAVGIINYSIVDFDVVEVTNLNRQFIYAPKDINHEKSKVMKDYILTKNDHAKVKTYNIKIENSQQIREIVENDNIDFIIASADTPVYNIQENITEAAIQCNVPCIFGGVGITEGSYGPLLYTKKAKLQYITEIEKILNSINFIFPCKSSFGVTNTLIATYMAWDIIMFLLTEKKLVKSLNKKIEISFRKI